MRERVDDYDYHYPPEAVAQEPAPRREDARLLRVARHAPPDRAILGEGVVADLPRLLRPGDLLVVNDTRVAPARLRGRRRETEGQVSVLVLAFDGARGEVLLGTRGRVAQGESIDLQTDALVVHAALGEGRFAVQTASGAGLDEVMEREGRMPLPPYIERDRVRDPRDPDDRERYQTTFAHDGAGRSAAAPTAGLHLTPEVLAGLTASGVELGRLRLEVGAGTFRPLRGEYVDEHVMHAESFRVSDDLAEAFAAARARGGRVVAVGTTVVRTLESVVSADGRELRTGAGRTELFLRPGDAFGAVDLMLTNFHQPRSSLLVLVSAFAGRATVRAAYTHALEAGYRFFSYGDATLLEPAPGAHP